MMLYWVLTLVLVMSSHVSDSSQLKGANLRIFFSEYQPYLLMKRNSSGQIVEVSGGCVERLNWLSQSLGFSYSIVQLPKPKFVEESLNYILNGDVDWLVGVLLMTEQRNKRIDFPYPWFADRNNLVLPYPSQLANTAAPLEPFTLPVWIFLITSAVTTVASIYFLNQIYCQIHSTSYDKRKYFFSTISRSVDYVVGVLLGQGGVCYSKRLNTRSVAAAWCLAASVLVYAYSSFLISFISAPNRQPIVKSIFDIPGNPRLKPVVVKGTGLDIIISNSEGGIGKMLRDILNRDPTLRCSNSSECLEMVRSGSKIFMDGYGTAMAAVNRDLKITKECHFTIAREQLATTYPSFAVPKYSNYTKDIRKGVMQMWETGLIDLWEKRAIPKPTACLNIKQGRMGKKPQLSMRHLSGPFVILLIGYGISAFSFLTELVYGRLFPTTEKQLFG